VCQKSSRSLKPFGHNTPTLQTDGRTDGRIFYGIGLDLTVGQKWCGYPMVKQFWCCVYWLWQNARTWRTHTHKQTPHDDI